MIALPRWSLLLIRELFAGYGLALGCKWNGIDMAWSLQDSADMDLSTKSPSLSRRHRRPHKTKVVVELLDEGMCLPLKSEYDLADFTVEGIRRGSRLSALGLPLPDDTGRYYGSSCACW